MSNWRAYKTSGISVALATFNGGRYLGQLLESIEQQELKPNEIVICDDGSADDTLEIVDKFITRNNLNIVFKKNDSRLGYSGNFLTAAKACSSRYIAFCDQDDIWFPEKLKILCKNMESTKADLCVHTATIINASGQTIGNFDNLIDDTRVFEQLSFPLPPWRTYLGFTMMFNSDLLDIFDIDQRGFDYNNYKQPLAHDSWIYFLASNFGKISTINRNLTAYRQHDSNTSGTLPKSLRRKLSLSAGEAFHPNRRRADVAKHQYTLIQNAIHSLDSEKAIGMSKAANVLKGVYEFESYREKMYISDKLVLRICMFIGKVLAGKYNDISKNRPQIGLMTKDLFVGVLRFRKQKG